MITNGQVGSVNPNVGIKGFDICTSNLNKAIMAIEERTMAGLLESAAFLYEDMDKTEPLIPVGETNNLRTLWRIVPFRNSKTVFGVICGFYANYALFVHEMVDKGKKINWTRPGSGPKFFEYAIKRNTKKIMEIIRRNAQLS